MKYDFDEMIDRRETDSIKWNKGIIKDEFGDGELLPLWIADMDFKCARPIIEALSKRVEHGIFGYSQAGEEYYEAVAKWNRRRHGLSIEKDWIVFVPGIVPAFNYLIRTFAKPGDKVVIQNPVYYPFSFVVANNGCHPVLNQLRRVDGSYRMDYEDLEAKAKDPLVKLMILCSPHNPVGRVWTREELEKAGEICARNGVIVIVDEIHSDIVMDGNRHVPFLGLPEKLAQQSVICTAPSKTFNLAGMQTANLIIKNEAMREAFKKTLKASSVGWGNPLGMTALTAAYNEGEEWLAQVLEYLEGNVDFMEAFIAEHMPEVGFARPEGTYLAWLDFRTLVSTEKELEELLRKKAKVALDEGPIFGEGGKGFARINFACPQSLLSEALHRIENAIRG